MDVGPSKCIGFMDRRPRTLSVFGFRAYFAGAKVGLPVGFWGHVSKPGIHRPSFSIIFSTLCSKQGSWEAKGNSSMSGIERFITAFMWQSSLNFPLKQSREGAFSRTPEQGNNYRDPLFLSPPPAVLAAATAFFFPSPAVLAAAESSGLCPPHRANCPGAVWPRTCRGLGRESATGMR